ncbi:DUF58 domain-containing protein [Leucobacter viscericola]|uniref:DUF58 domain-containing protein n=1 Tax=Leucobacter viscericola TaxID=2714935 RepID=A0A6G7XEV5_9MICO|nr:DUF58 domain-containing protein [Leucobacter viscericola]QIK63095.1 DUF58 domain-containing protein [Leucobacter viscericola]
MSTLIEQVKSKLFIVSSRLSTNALDGEYQSALRGRSLDFDDLHRYEHGDDIRDIDWRATARLGVPLVKRSKAERAQTVLFAVDSGRGMAALAPDGNPKRDLAILAMGVLGFLSLRHGDQFGVLSGDADQVQRSDIRRSEGALEVALRKIQTATTPSSARSDIEKLLDTVVRTVSRRCILVVIADAAPISARTEKLLRRLRVQHDVVWVTIADADPILETRGSGTQRVDIDTGWQIPDFLNGDEEVLEELSAFDRANASRRAALMVKLGITHAELREPETAVAELLRMLDRRSRV